MSHKVSYKVKENSIYTTIWGILQECGDLLGGCLTAKNFLGQWTLNIFGIRKVIDVYHLGDKNQNK